MKARHHRVLDAICSAVDPKTGCACISQARISSRGNISRQYVPGLTHDLQDWGYIRRIHRGRRLGGKFKTLLYEILYEAPPLAQDVSGDDTDRVAHGGDVTVSPPEVAESDLLSPDIHNGSDSAGAEAQTARPGRTSRASALPDNDEPTGRQATNQALSPATPDANRQDEGAFADASLRQAVARSKAEALERDYRDAAETRICKGLFEAFPDNGRADAVDTVKDELYQSAVDAEMRRSGAGVSMVVRAVKKAMAGAA